MSATPLLSARASDALARCALGSLPANVALMTLLGEVESRDAARAALGSAREGVAEPDARARIAAAERLLAELPESWGAVREVLSLAEHGPVGNSANGEVARWAGIFDRLAERQPEAGVALYALGSPDLLRAATAELVDLLRSWGVLGPERTALEIGCGSGRFVAALAPEVGRVVGLDNSTGMVTVARRATAALPNVTVALSNGYDLRQVGDAAAHLVLAADVFPYLVTAGSEVVTRYLAEIARVLVPGGALAVLNYSYRGDDAADDRELRDMATSAGLEAIGEPGRPLRLWDGRAYRFRRPG